MMDLAAFLTVPNISLVGVGVVIATSASLLGIGGGLLWVPYFILVYGFSARSAVMLSFLIQIVGMGSAAVENIRSKNVCWRIAGMIFPFVAAGVVAGAFLNQRIMQTQYIETGLGISGIIVSLIFAFQSEHCNALLTLDRSARPPVILMPVSALFGTVSGMFSIGIGDFLIPLVREKMRMPMRYIVGTNLLLNFQVALIGTVSYFLLSGFVLKRETWTVLVFSWTGVVIGGQIGPRLVCRITDDRIREIFIFVFLLIGIHLLYQSL
ncbi:MAG: sulfite exporter TauE/SafE family protein [Spirochaetota bacterium]